MDADVIVIGGGPAGSTAARYLAKNGISTIIIDKEKFPRKKVCASGLLEHSFIAFPEVKPFVNCYNYGVRVISPNMQTAFEVHSDSPMMAMTHGRAHFDNELLQLAKLQGVIVKEGITVKSVENLDDSVKILLEDGEVLTSKLLIGADSACSIVAKSLNIGMNIKDPDVMGIAIEKEFPISEKLMDQYFTKERIVSLYLHYGHMFGYGWLFPRKDSLNIGIGGTIQQGKELSNQFHHLITSLKTQNVIPSDLDDSHPDAALLPCTIPNENSYTPRVMLIGDAGGFCSSATGEGIFYAMTSGKLAADASKQILSNQDFSLKGMQIFYDLWKKSIGTELKFQYFAKEKILSNERRCRAAVNWASQDPKLKQVFIKFLTGGQDYQHLGIKMGNQYIRCKIKDKLHVFKKPQADKDFEANLKRNKQKW